MGIVVAAGARLEVRHSAFDNNRQDGIVLHDSVATVRDSVINAGETQTADGLGLLAHGSRGALLAERVSVINGRKAGVGSQIGAKVTLRASTVRGTRPRGGMSIGVTVDSSSTLEMRDSAVLENRGAGLAVIQGTATDKPPQATVERTLVARTLPHASGDKGYAVGAQSGVVTMSDCALVDNAEIGALVLNELGALRLNRTLVMRTQQTKQRFGYGLLALNQATLQLIDSEVSQSPCVGIAVVDSSAVLNGGAVARNSIAVQVVGKTDLKNTATADALAPNVFLVSDTTTFFENDSRVGGGALPLPEPPSPGFGH